ncbi:hypothetical protein H2198_003148 [Neophaeococcomyces mojaviensis]|uniref:Uncharacterized protein n=1 Tax=Neophaeococcomyces mojaviensis TaxID=3383035 RepID=A0ACC3ACN9_9EURO|nr:hypothetical protein H2198_003148 [Knufia sp. JES_112]
MSTLLTPAQWTLAAGSAIYPLAFYISLPKNATPARFAQSREAISIFHCTFMTIASLACLRQSDVRNLLSSRVSDNEIPDRDLPIITTRSEFANSVIALETAYLLQDSVILFYASKLHRRAGGSTKGLNIKHLAYHHAGLSAALVVLQVYTAQGREKGVLIIIMMMLMNASSPCGTLRWFLVNFKPDARRAIMITTAVYLKIYGLCRVYLIYYILHAFGAQKGRNAFEAFVKLKWHCQFGVGAMAFVNTAWFVMGVSNFVKRYLTGTSVNKKNS